MNVSVKVHLLGRDYLLRSQGDPALVQEAASLVEEKLSGLTSSVSVDTRDKYILALLNLAGEYLQEKRKNQEREDDQQRLTETGLFVDEQSLRAEAELIERIESALK